MITFNRFEYSKELFEQYRSSLDLDEDAIVLIDSGTDKYIYAKGSYFGSTEIYKGNTEPTDESIKLWIDTDGQFIKYKDNTNTWVTIGGGGGKANVLVINSHVDFIIGEELNTTGGVINDENITYAKVQEAVDNGYTIALKEPSGNISYCIKADYAVPNQNGEKRIMLFFSWRISDVEYAAMLYVGLDNSLTYMKWKLDLATKEYVDGAIEDIPSGGGGSSVEVVDSLDSEDTTAALSANQGRVLKEMIVQSGGGSTDVDIFPSEYSDEFNNDFTN